MSYLLAFLNKRFSVLHKISSESKSIKNHTMFFTAGIVLLTLVVNAPTTGLLIKKLKLAKESELSRAMLRKVLDEHNNYAEEYI